MIRATKRDWRNEMYAIMTVTRTGTTTLLCAVSDVHIFQAAEALGIKMERG